MPRKSALLWACAGSGLTLAALTGALLLTPVPAAAPAQVQASLSAQADAPPAYELRAVEGTIRVFQAGEEILDTGVPLSLLPREDREALEAGIAVPTREALTALLEDLDF